MAKEKKVQQITNMEVDFAQWYTDICRKAELVEYASVKGFTILRPYGYAIWENIQSIMDAEFKKTGHENVAMPVLIPESLLKKEGDDVVHTLIDLCARFVRQHLVDDPLVKPQLTAIRGNLEHVILGRVNSSAVYQRCTLRKSFDHFLLMFGGLRHDVVVLHFRGREI